MPKHNVVIVMSGTVKVSTLTSTGHEKVLFYLISGEILGESLYFVDDHIDVKALSVEDVTVSYIEDTKLDKFLMQYPNTYRFFIHSLTRKYRIALSQINDFLAECPKTRIASTLYRLAVLTPKTSNNTYNINLTMTHQELANLIGCSRVTVTRTINELKNENIIDMKNKEIRILNMEALKKLSQLT
jgi:CRP-like cAMP-binding protein